MFVENKRFHFFSLYAIAACHSRVAVYIENELKVLLNVIRTFAHSAVVCGSMVPCLYCVSFFAPAGAKNDTQRVGNRRASESPSYLLFVFSLAERKHE